MTKSIHCAQLLAKSHSANYSSLTRNEHISQSASIRCSLWTNPNTLQPNPAPSWKKHIIPREKGGGCSETEGCRKEKKKRASRHSMKPQKREKKRGKQTDRERERTIHPIRNVKLKKPSSLSWTSTSKCVKWKEACDWLLSDLVRSDGVYGWERKRERCICYMSQ